MNLLIFFLIVFEVLLNTLAQLSLKVGMERIGGFSFSWNNFAPIGWQVLTSPWIMSGLFIYVISMIVWLMVLSRAEVSLVYPLTSLGYILTVLIAYLFLGEHISIMRICGVMIITLGVFVLARS